MLLAIISETQSLLRGNFAVKLKQGFRAGTNSHRHATFKISNNSTCSYDSLYLPSLLDVVLWLAVIWKLKLTHWRKMLPTTAVQFWDHNLIKWKNCWFWIILSGPRWCRISVRCTYSINLMSASCHCTYLQMYFFLFTSKVKYRIFFVLKCLQGIRIYIKPIAKHEHLYFPFP